jgi:RimJ/RimL family protein N-acetyltransferase
MNTSLGDIRIERLTRQYLEDELEAAHQSVEYTLPWMEWCRPDLTRAELEPIFMAMEDDWDREEAFTFAILDVSSNVFLGTVGLNRINKLEKTANLHYWVRAGQTGRGIASKAARLAARFGLTEKGFQRIGIIVPEGNRPSERVAERLGAQREGVLRNVCRLHDQPVNATVYSLIPADLDGVLAA